jgi:hypothetical protein
MFIVISTYNCTYFRYQWTSTINWNDAQFYELEIVGSNFFGPELGPYPTFSTKSPIYFVLQSNLRIVFNIHIFLLSNIVINCNWYLTKFLYFNFRNSSINLFGNHHNTFSISIPLSNLNLHERNSIAQFWLVDFYLQWLHLTYPLCWC